MEGFGIGDANQTVVEDGGEENNSTKMTPKDGEKNDFPSAIPKHCKSPTKIINHMKMEMILMESLFTLMNLLKQEEIRTCF